MNIVDKLVELGYDVPSTDYYRKIKEWQEWYEGSVPDFHNYRVFNGCSHITCHRYTLSMAKKVSEDWANLLMNEKVQITLEGEREQEFFDAVCARNNFRAKVNEMQEFKAALGTAAYVFRVTGADIDVRTGKLSGDGGEIRIDYCPAPGIIPLSWENGYVSECAFWNTRTVKKAKYVYLQIHKLDGGEYVIENKIYRCEGSNADQLAEVPLSSVPGFSNVPARIRTGSDKRQFVIDRFPIANNYDLFHPMGISVYANAIDQLRGVDVAYDSYVNEFILGKKRIIVKPEAIKTYEGEPLFDPADTIFYVLPEDTRNSNIIDQIDMNLRTTEHSAGIQDMLNMLSSKCGFGENHYRYDRGSVATATQVISENSSMFRTMRKYEIPLEAVLVEMARIILRLGNTYMHANLNEDVEISVDFDDSVIEDKGSEFARDMQMLSAGILNDWEFRAKWMNEDVNTAKASLPGMEDLIRTKADERRYTSE